MKVIPGSNGEYSVTKSGRVYSHKSNKYLTQFVRRGYNAVTLAKTGRVYQRFVHRLVAITYLPNPKNLPQINHKDGNKMNNALGNLEWCTAQENIQHAATVLGMEFGARNRKLAAQDVKKIRQLIHQGVGDIAISNRYNVSDTCIYNLRTGLSYKNV